MLFGKKQSLVGLDIGSHTIKAVELQSHSSKGYQLVNWGISPPLAEAIVDGAIILKIQGKSYRAHRAQPAGNAKRSQK